METTSLRQFLEVLCNSLIWDYAVFWKLRHQNPAVLSWEDGCYNQQRPRTPSENSPDMLYFDGSNELPFFNDETGLIYGTASQYQFELLMADMSSLQHVLGEGLVSKVASTYGHHWISLADISSAQLDYDNPVEFPEELLPSLLAGVKTILLVSVHPYGVLQLGSSAEVPEDPAFVDLVKEIFFGHPVISRCASPSTPEEDHPRCSSPLLDDMDESSFISKTNAELEKLLHQDSPVDSEEASNTSIFGSLQDILGELDENKDLFHSDMAQNEQFSNASLGADIPEFFNRVMDSYITSNIITGSSGDEEEDAEYTTFEALGSIFSIPVDYDLFEALGPSFQSQTSEFSGFEAPTVDNPDFPNVMEPSAWELGECDAKVKVEDLLEAVVANLVDGLDGTSPNSSETLTSSAIPLVQCGPVPSSKPMDKSKDMIIGIGGCDSSVLWNNIEAAYGNSSRKSPNSTSSKSTDSCLTDKEQAREGQKHQLSGSKRKGRSGDNQRPRPRDRQLIQDRVKELRELVPNGSKCSIDALLDRTVKHMHFLRSVTNQAEKLRKCVPPKESRPKIWESLGIDKEDCEKGRGWAFDFGGEFQVFPIVVEDLEYPGQMLVEMMCDEQGLFLEIAQVIRRLELTILKGVMETRSDNTWARFIVEASKGFQRTEIFWPLMQVLQQRGKPIPGIV